MLQNLDIDNFYHFRDFQLNFGVNAHSVLRIDVFAVGTLLHYKIKINDNQHDKSIE